MKEPIIIKAHEQTIKDLLFTPDNSLLLTASADHAIRAWAFGSWDYKFELYGHTKSVNKIVLKEADNLLISVSNDLTIRFWELEQRKEILPLKDHKKAIIAAAISPGESLLATGSQDGQITFWCLETMEKLTSVKTTNATLTSLSFAPNSSYLLSGNNSGKIDLWLSLNGKLKQRIPTPLKAIASVIHFARGKKVLTSGLSNAIVVLKTKDWSKQSTIKMPEEALYRSFLSPDEQYIAIVYDHTLEIRKLKTGKLLQKVKVKTKVINAVAFSQDNQFLAAASSKNVLIWKIEDLS